MDSGTTADIEHGGRCGGKVATKQFLGAQELQLPVRHGRQASPLVVAEA
ncbi:hypothetical protein ACRYCC_31075 [Actinomadura scrupuli]